MNAVLQNPKITIEDYLKNELVAEIRHEYIDGAIYAMSGASKNHEKIAFNLARKLGNHLENMPCDIYSGNVKVYVGKTKFFYPDIMVVCNENSDNDYYTKNPLIIVEVLSKSTRRIDHTTKRFAYRQIETLQEYVLIEQDIVHIEVSRRSTGWDSQHYFLGDEIIFETLDLKISVADIYRRVDNEEMREFLENNAK